MNAILPINLPDVQGRADRRGLAIQQVGVKAVRHPLRLRTADGVQGTVAVLDMFVALPAEQKGTHMSRFLEVLQAETEPLDSASLQALLARMLLRLDAEAGEIVVRAPMFRTKAAPVSGIPSLMDYDVVLGARRVDGRDEAWLEVAVAATSLCPCSKAISRYGAHNQRSRITIEAALATGARMLPDDLIAAAEAAASCEVYGLLKRDDERYVTERAYENPKFVEDLVRDVAVTLKGEPRLAWFAVASENFESIHNHSAYARLEGRPDL